MKHIDNKMHHKCFGVRCQDFMRSDRISAKKTIKKRFIIQGNVISIYLFFSFHNVKAKTTTAKNAIKGKDKI